MSEWSNPPVGEPRVVEVRVRPSRTLVVVDAGDVDERAPLYVPDMAAELLIGSGWTPPDREVPAVWEERWRVQAQLARDGEACEQAAAAAVRGLVNRLRHAVRTDTRADPDGTVWGRAWLPTGEAAGDDSPAIPVVLP